MLLPSPEVDGNLNAYFLEGKATFRVDNKLHDSAMMLETSDFSGIPLVSMICTNNDSEILGIVVRQQPTEDINAPQVAELVQVKEFWK